MPVSLHAKQHNKPLCKRNKECWEITGEAFNVNKCHFVHQYCESFLFTNGRGILYTLLWKVGDLELALVDPVIKQIPPSSSPWSEEWHLNFSCGNMWIKGIPFLTTKVWVIFFAIFINILLGEKEVGKKQKFAFWLH